MGISGPMKTTLFSLGPGLTTAISCLFSPWEVRWHTRHVRRDIFIYSTLTRDIMVGQGNIMITDRVHYGIVFQESQ